jgi:hypothetical protein
MNLTSKNNRLLLIKHRRWLASDLKLVEIHSGELHKNEIPKEEL